MKPNNLIFICIRTGRARCAMPPPLQLCTDSQVYGGCTAEAAVSEASGPRVSGCIRAPLYFHPHPVDRLRHLKQTLFTGRQSTFFYRVSHNGLLVSSMGGLSVPTRAPLSSPFLPLGCCNLSWSYLHYKLSPRILRGPRNAQGHLLPQI